MFYKKAETGQGQPQTHRRAPASQPERLFLSLLQVQPVPSSQAPIKDLKVWFFSVFFLFFRSEKSYIHILKGLSSVCPAPKVAAVET